MSDRTRGSRVRKVLRGRPPAPVAAFVATVAIATLAAMPAAAETGRVRYVTDGDTFRLESGERIRIAAIDAPETHPDQARCRREITVGRASAASLRAMIDGRDVRFARVGRSYNRTVARVWLDGRDVGEALVASGAARPWPRFSPKPDWCNMRSAGPR